MSPKTKQKYWQLDNSGRNLFLISVFHKSRICLSLIGIGKTSDPIVNDKSYDSIFSAWSNSCLIMTRSGSAC